MLNTRGFIKILIMIRKHSVKSRVRLSIIFLASLGFILIAATKIHAQVTLGARSISMGQAATALPENEWAIFGNPAMLSGQQKSVSFFAIRYYGLSELTDAAAVIVYPTKIGVIAGGAHRYGGELFNQSRIRIAYKNSSQGFHYGASLNYSHIKQGGGYGSVGALGINVGIAAEIIQDFWIGAKATNINQPKYGEFQNIDEDLPRNLSIGFSYRLSGVALFTADVLKDVQFPVSFRSGIEIKIIDHLTGRAGITMQPRTFSGGFGYNTNNWGVNLAVQQHEEAILGLSPGLDFNISW